MTWYGRLVCRLGDLVSGLGGLVVRLTWYDVAWHALGTPLAIHCPTLALCSGTARRSAYGVYGVHECAHEDAHRWATDPDDGQVRVLREGRA